MLDNRARGPLYCMFKFSFQDFIVGLRTNLVFVGFRLQYTVLPNYKPYLSVVSTKIWNIYGLFIDSNVASPGSPNMNDHYSAGRLCYMS